MARELVREREELLLENRLRPPVRLDVAAWRYVVREEDLREALRPRDDALAEDADREKDPRLTGELREKEVRAEDTRFRYEEACRYAEARELEVKREFETGCALEAGCALEEERELEKDRGLTAVRLWNPDDREPDDRETDRLPEPRLTEEGADRAEECPREPDELRELRELRELPRA